MQKADGAACNRRHARRLACTRANSMGRLLADLSRTAQLGVPTGRPDRVVMLESGRSMATARGRLATADRQRSRATLDPKRPSGLDRQHARHC